MIVSIEVFASSLSILGCLWIIFKYFQQPKNNIGLLLIFVLAISDLIFSLSILIQDIMNTISPIFDVLFSFTMYFSILWASAVSYIVYKSLKDLDFNLPKVFRNTILMIFIISSASTAYFQNSLSQTICLILITPLALSIISTIVFYSMSINILKKRAEYSPISTNIYVRTLRSYSIVQFITYGPLILFLLGGSSDKSFYSNLIEFFDVFFYMEILKTIASLSGLLNALIFITHGTGNLKRTSASTEDQNSLETDLTMDNA